MTHVAFPPPSGPMLVPTSSRRAFRSGVSMWSATRPRARFVQRAIWLVGGWAGPRLIPGRRQQIVQDMPDEVQHEHRSAWHAWFGEYDEQALYRPRQAGRSGVSMLLLRQGIPRGFVKVRPEWDAGPEQRATSRLGEAETFKAPAVIGLHAFGGWTSLGFAALPGRIHSPRVTAPIRAISEEVSELVRLDSPGPPGWRPMHGDMGPWNLRRMSGVGTVLFDWEYIASAPPFADLVFYLAAARATGLHVREDAKVNEEAVSYWQDRITQRFRGGSRDDRLADAMSQALVRLAQ
jgi:hypothetical protein